VTLLGPGQPGSRLHFHNQHGECLASAGSAITHSARRDPPGAPPPGPPRISRCSPGSVPCLPPTVPAMTTFEQALRLHAASGRPFDRARTELLYGESLRRRRKRLQAREHLRAANELFERLSADPWAERARTELRASGETPRRRDPGRAQQLTPPQSTRSPASSLQAPLARKPQPGSSSAREPSTRTFAASTPSSASPPVVNCKPPILTTSGPAPRTRMTWVEPTHRTGRSGSSARAIRRDSRARRFGVIRVIEDQITTLRPYNARYTGDPRSIFRKTMWRRSPVYHSFGAILRC
jgi:hypothetical protein